jgi:hypothetical protein
LSHAFLAIARGEFEQAAAMHAGSLWIYGALVVLALAGAGTSFVLLAAVSQGMVAKGGLHR